MANKDNHYGFRPISYDSSMVKTYSIDTGTGTATAVFLGDLVKGDTDGNASVMTAASNDYIGVVMELFNSAGLSVLSLAASTAGSVRVCTDPNAKLQVQFENGGTAPTVAARNDAADAIWTHAGSTKSGLAGVELSETLAGDGNAAQFRILELVDKPDNVWGHNAEVIVVALEHAYNTTPNAI